MRKLSDGQTDRQTDRKRDRQTDSVYFTVPYSFNETMYLETNPIRIGIIKTTTEPKSLASEVAPFTKFANIGTSKNH